MGLRSFDCIPILAVLVRSGCFTPRRVFWACAFEQRLSEASENESESAMARFGVMKYLRGRRTIISERAERCGVPQPWDTWHHSIV